jgi:hypothetical protein
VYKITKNHNTSSYNDVEYKINLEQSHFYDDGYSLDIKIEVTYPEYAEYTLNGVPRTLVKDLIHEMQRWVDLGS